MEGNGIIAEVKTALPTWIIVVVVTTAAVFFIYRNLRETQLIELQVTKLKKELGKNA